MILCGGAINSPQLLQLSGVGKRRRAGGARHRRRRTTCRASARTCRTTSRSTSSTRASSRCRCSRRSKWRTGRGSALQWLLRRRGPGGDQPLRGGRLRPLQRRRRLPEPDVPLPAARGPLRRHARPAASHGYQVHVGPMYSDARGLGARSRSTDPREHPRCASTTCRPSRTGASGSRRSGSPATILDQPAFAPSTAASCRPGRRSRPTSRSSSGSRQDAETALHPSCTCRMGTDEMRSSTRATMRVHGVDGLRVVDASVDAVRHQRQHLRAGDDGRPRRPPT